VRAESEAVFFERGEEVERRWQRYLSNPAMLYGIEALGDFIKAAAARPELRQLFPYTSLHTFCFSRCTGFPYTEDTPRVTPSRDGYVVRLAKSALDPRPLLLGRGDAETAADLVVKHLPPGCGPAVAGTAEDLGDGAGE
jgi:hypothetical protein